ncbi:MAG TPA: hypothetical protein VFS39_04125 [Nitrospira sp.]|nr:hypothetical protein [Nitrospira sp.]
MKIIGFLLMLALASLGSEVHASRIVRDFSGDAMQRYDSRMLGSPLTAIPTLLGTSIWPLAPFFMPNVSTVLHIHLELQAPEPAGVQKAALASRPKFWIFRCDHLIELSSDQTGSVMEEEAKPCEK